MTGDSLQAQDRNVEEASTSDLKIDAKSIKPLYLFPKVLQVILRGKTPLVLQGSACAFPNIPRADSSNTGKYGAGRGAGQSSVGRSLEGQRSKDSVFSRPCGVGGRSLVTEACWMDFWASSDHTPFFNEFAHGPSLVFDRGVA